MKTLLPAGLQVRWVGILLAGLAVEAWAHPGHHLLQIMPAPGVPVATNAVPANADARLSIAVIDAKTGRPTPVRVLITDGNGRPLGAPGLPSIVPTPAAIAARLAEPGAVVGLPKEAIAVMHGRDDSAEAYGFQANGAFFISGSFLDMPIPAGTYRITLAKGYEYLELNDELVIKRGENVRRRYELRRWIDMPARGWYSSDDHIHLRRSPRENPLILDWIAAEDVHVGVLLQMGDFWTSYYHQYAFGPRGIYGRGNHLLVSGQEEPRTHELGHTISFGAAQYVRMQSEYYSFDRVFDRIHQLGGVSGYAHAGVMMFQGYRGLALDTLGGKIDFLEVMQFCAQKGPLALEHYYRFLDLGCKLTATGGSDFPWCGRGMRPGEEQFGPRIGDGRFYTYLGGELSFDRWLAGVKAGHTFVSSGPMIELLVNGRLPGSAIDLRPGEKIRVTARAWGHAARIPLQRLQIVGHSQVLREVTPSGAGQGPAELSLDFELTPEHGIWIAARADAGPTQFAHTTPVYVTVNDDGFHTRTNLDAQIALTRQHLEEIRGLLRPKGGPEEIDRRRTPLPWRIGDGSTRLEQRIADTLQKLETLRRRN